jgi:hypothetical protein|tara:strand:- start:25 stop:258 length:234 start_codon:yes stop_codon:yes gene_type:complete
MNKRSVIESILYAIVAFMLIALLYAFSTMMMARNEAYGEIMACMGEDRSEAAYEACFEELKNERERSSGSSHVTLDK